ncbi:MAG: tRNA (adenosine(37)-N6)-threonylcarbamoyltransferase complex ATPase subunit type 1 TsaE [Bacteroidetes bacterium]|nr:tRNA (adenosine(37)-N6)-threonylcarbamoyltransferase complex ATPase subunit type 1 TsaE [Bacteroidota bacterium]
MRLSQLWPDYSIFAFYGAMGAGKTTLIKALCLHWGVGESVNSPTFALVNEYETAEAVPVYHFDFYRIESLTEVFDIGYEHYFFSGYPCLIEWPEKIGQLLPDDCVKVIITHGALPDDRIIEVYLPVPK